MPRLHGVRERLGRIITCPVGQNLYTRPGWNPDVTSHVLSMTLLPDRCIREAPAELIGVDVWLESTTSTMGQARGNYFRAPVSVLMDHYGRRHGSLSDPYGALDVAAHTIERLEELYPAPEAGKEAMIDRFRKLWSDQRTTVLELYPCTIPVRGDARVMSSAPIDALAVLEVIQTRDIG